ncbi:DMT family transporter [Amycolatopsis taiwanensis]|nr:DMT family transporter [Amycolatopsis taiwanensis]
MPRTGKPPATMGELLALASAACYGLSDFAGGLLSRRASFVAVALIGQLSGLALAFVAAAITTSALPGLADLGWGAASGVGTGIGMMFLFRGLSRGAMSVVVPVSAVGGVALPVLVGVTLGSRPSPVTWLGIALTLPALWLVSQPRRGTGRQVLPAMADGLIASGGIALQYLALAQAGPHSGLWPVVAGRVTAAATIAALAVPVGTGLRLRLPTRHTLTAVMTGGSAALALVCYLLATRDQLMVVAVVLSSLYPVIPVLLGIGVLGERLSRQQIAGTVGAGLAIALIVAG